MKTCGVAIAGSAGRTSAASVTDRIALSASSRRTTEAYPSSSGDIDSTIETGEPAWWGTIRTDSPTGGAGGLVVEVEK